MLFAYQNPFTNKIEVKFTMNEINIEIRQEQLRNLQKYIKDTDNDITLILQSLQWDRKHLKQGEQKLTCKYDPNHRIPANNVREHEEKCYLKSQNYVPGELFFPEPLYPNAVTVVKLSADNKNDIINYAVKTDPSFKTNGNESCVLGHAPMTLGRLQATHSTDERRALYDAVAAAVPPPAPRDPPGHDPATDDPVTSSARGGSSRVSLLALRDARRRRAKYRGATRDGYQHELRGLISAQMELFTGKLKEEEADNKPDVTVDKSDSGRRCGRESDRRNRVHNDSKTKYLNTSRREHVRDYERGNERKEYERENKRRENERESRNDKNREYSRESRQGKRSEYEYEKRYKEGNNIYEHDHRRRPQQHDKEYMEIKQEKDDYQTERRKREDRHYDYKDRKQETDRSRSRENKKHHKRGERHHKHTSDERHRGRSRDKEYDRYCKSDKNGSFLKIKKEPPDYD